MFESALLESSSGTLRGSSFWSKGLSFTVEAILVGGAVLVPLLYTEALPKQLGYVEVPAPPPAAPAPHGSILVRHAGARSELNDGQVMLPTVIPLHAREIHEQSMGGTSGQGDPLGVIGAPPNGPVTGTIVSLLNALPPAMPRIATPHSVRVSSGVAQGLLIREVRPQYPALARSARIQGVVVLQATIGKDGTIQNLRLLSGHPLLVPAAVEAVRQWRYRPYLLNTEPVEVDTTIQVNFTLTGAH